MNTLLTFLDNNRQRLNLERYGVPARLTCVIVTPRFRTSSHVVFLVLPKGQPDPVLVAKVSRLTGAGASLEQEVINLRTIQASRSDGFNSIPRVVAFEEYCGHLILVETALIGRPMNQRAVRRDLAGCCNAVSGWLADVQQPVRNPAHSFPPFTGGVEEDWFERLVEWPLRYFEKVFPLSVEEQHLLEQTREVVTPLRQMNLPLVFEHGDLCQPNILLLKNGGVGVIDWELAEPNGLPACDLFFFLTNVAFTRHKAHSKGNYLSAFQSALFGSGAWARNYVAAYAERLQLPPTSLTPLLVLCWLRYTANLLFRLGNTGRSQRRLGPETVTWLRANRYYTLWRYTVTHVNELQWHNLASMKRGYTLDTPGLAK